ncbi:MAG: hypothetical protein KatS3mg131_2558 [Candidatus Tectimicrobiota bacterium]|nr:MAG: hypothetical protein KatS3mg131_2558 [Candidatus Tectomicrobia bacterium]
MRPADPDTRCPFVATVAALPAAWLAERLAAPVTLAWTRNRVVMVRVRVLAGGGYRVRLHGCFRQAPMPVWQALVAYIRHGDRTARAILRRFLQGEGALAGPEPAGSCPARGAARGRYFDLEEILRTLNRRYFGNRVQARIVWGRRPPRRQRVSIRLGSYCARTRLIRIHPALDQAFVPRYVVESVVFHEMLHQLVPCRRVRGRRCLHPPRFRQWERQFPAYARAEAWKRRHLTRLLRS